MDKQQITALLNNFNSNEVEVLVKDASNGAFIDIDGTEIYNSTSEGINRFHLLVGGNGGGAEPANSISIPDIYNSFLEVPIQKGNACEKLEIIAPVQSYNNAGIEGSILLPATNQFDTFLLNNAPNINEIILRNIYYTLSYIVDYNGNQNVGVFNSLIAPDKTLTFSFYIGLNSSIFSVGDCFTGSLNSNENSKLILKYYGGDNILYHYQVAGLYVGNGLRLCNPEVITNPAYASQRQNDFYYGDIELELLHSMSFNEIYYSDNIFVPISPIENTDGTGFLPIQNLKRLRLHTERILDNNFNIGIGSLDYLDLSVCDLELSTNLYNIGIEKGWDIANNYFGGHFGKSITINDIVD